jgi:hypothetical protein
MLLRSTVVDLALMLSVSRRHVVKSDVNAGGLGELVSCAVQLNAD